MPIEFLKKTSQQVNDNLLTHLIDKQTAGYRKPRGFQRLHASELTKENFCPRKFVLMNWFQLSLKDEYIPLPLSMTFHEGEDKQARINNEYLRPRMWGFWKCGHCRKEFGFGPAVAVCDQCNHPNPKYKEAVFTLKNSILQGAIDGFVSANNNDLRPIEIKIMAPSMFKGLKMPLVEHRIRSKLYLYLIANAQQDYAQKVSTERVHVLYVLRGYGFKDATTGSISPLREYVVHRDDTEIEPYIEKASAVSSCMEKNKALLLKGDTSGVIPYAPKGICSGPTDKCAKTCPAAKECFLIPIDE